MSRLRRQICVALTAIGIAALGGLAATSSPAYAATLRSAAGTAQLSGAPGFSPARFAAIQPGTTIVAALRNQATGQCLDDSGQFGLRMFPCNLASYNSGFQKWTLNERLPGIVQMRNAATNLCVDDSAQFGVRDFGCNDPSFNNGFQAWAFYTYGSANPTALENLATRMCLDDSSAGLRVFGCNQTSYNNGFQKWLLGIPTN